MTLEEAIIEIDKLKAAIDFQSYAFELNARALRIENDNQKKEIERLDKLLSIKTQSDSAVRRDIRKKVLRAVDDIVGGW